MTTVQEKLQKRAAELLESNEVVEVIAWSVGRFANQTTPFFAATAAEAAQIVFNEYCVNTLAKYVLNEKAAGKIAVCVRGCDARAINRMIADNQLKREEVYLLGIPCPGMKDRLTNELLEKCLLCTHKNPPVYDELLGELVAEDEEDQAIQRRFASIEALEAQSRKERLEHFNTIYNSCIRCYACREVCPVCTCRECFVDQLRAGWQGKQNNLNENRYYNLVRVFHIGDRCIECGECARACPMDLPLMEINRKWIKDLDTLFATGEAGLTDELDNALGRYDLSDLEEFM